MRPGQLVWRVFRVLRGYQVGQDWMVLQVRRVRRVLRGLLEQLVSLEHRASKGLMVRKVHKVHRGQLEQRVILVF